MHLPSSSHCCSPSGTVFLLIYISTYTRCLRTNSIFTLLSLANALIMEETELLNKYINSSICEFLITILLSQFPYQVKLRLSDEILRYKVRSDKLIRKQKFAQMLKEGIKNLPYHPGKELSKQRRTEKSKC